MGKWNVIRPAASSAAGRMMNCLVRTRGLISDVTIRHSTWYFGISVVVFPERLVCRLDLLYSCSRIKAIFAVSLLVSCQVSAAFEFVDCCFAVGEAVKVWRCLLDGENPSSFAIDAIASTSVGRRSCTTSSCIFKINIFGSVLCVVTPKPVIEKVSSSSLLLMDASEREKILL